MKSSDYLVIGSGIAGLIFALDVADHGSVTVLCKAEPVEGNTRYAQGGIASVTSPDDSFQSHIKDTLECGAGICHSDIVDLVVRNAPSSIQHLTALGTHFDTEPNGVEADGDQHFVLGREGGHSARRILHSGDATGAEIQRAVYERASNHPNITILPYHIGVDLIISPLAEPQDGYTREVLGAYALDKVSGTVEAFSARMTMLATGGVGKVYLYTSNPDVATGDGIAMAYRAGAQIGNMEFIQFHPTCLYHLRAKSFLLTEALRGEGALLTTVRGHRFMPDYHPMAELAPRDIVARAIDDQMKRTGDDYVLLDITHRDAEFIKHRFPTIFARTQELGFDITKEPVPVVPAAHYCCGGVVTDSLGRTNLRRLYCAGETACTGLHGANRLASNSLLEAIVFAERAASDSKEQLKRFPHPTAVAEWDYLNTVKSSEEVLVSYFWDEIRRMMWNLVGIVRSDKRLELAKRRIAMIKQEVRDYYWRFSVSADLIELRNIIQVAEIIVHSAGARRESRGLHYNLDCLDLDEANWKHDTVLELGKSALPEIVQST
ncbi:MAG: L-aspartate oxidase [Bdellovibrionota bacterium]